MRDFLSNHKFETIDVITQSTVSNEMKEGVLASSSARAKQLWQSAVETSPEEPELVLAVRLDFWSDDFEPNQFSKTNRNSIWIKTFTIGTVHNEGQQLRATYPCAVGRKNVSHDAVEKRMADESKQLRSGTLPPFYVGSKKQSVHLHFDLFCNLQDQPERRSSNHMMAGNAQYAGRWRVSADHLELYPKLKACDDCLLNFTLGYIDGNEDYLKVNCD